MTDSIGARLRAARERATFTIDQAAEKIRHLPGIGGSRARHAAWLLDVELGRHTPIAKDIARLIELYDVGSSDDTLYAAAELVPPDVRAVISQPPMWLLVRALPAIAAQATVTLDYTNWRGQRATRRVQPRALTFEATTHHPTAQWLLHGLCLDRGEVRSFAVADIHAWTPEAPANAPR